MFHHALLSCTTSCRPLTCSGYIGCVMSKKVCGVSMQCNPPRWGRLAMSHDVVFFSRTERVVAWNGICFVG
jgi:hypothetical protein